MKYKRFPMMAARNKLTCARCGCEFWTQRGTARYCSDACKQAAYRERKAR
jgi:hypothetical protein